MSDLVANPEDRFSPDEAHIESYVCLPYGARKQTYPSEPCHEKMCLRESPTGQDIN